MDFCEALRANDIDPDKFIALQNEFIIQCRKTLEKDRHTINYREHLERDQLLTMLEKFVNRLEREQLQQKIRKVSTS